MPQQMVCPAAWLPQGVHIRATEKIGLHIHLKHIELPSLDLLLHKLVAGVKATRMTTHRHQTCLLLQGHHLGTVLVHIA